jgi:DMSO/TMAO reductase YedYZ molybdopterin-dependent catalytic subunit
MHNKYYLYALILMFLIAACGQQVKTLRPAEIKEYQGEKLSSIKEFRENSIKGPQKIDIKNYKLKITGLVQTPAQFTYNEVLNNYPHYKKVISLDCVEGWSVTILWEGLLAKDILATAKPSPETKTIIFKAYDGYSTSFPIDYVMKNDILIAYKMNNVTLPAERGFPFELVAESKWGYKWIKWITEIELSSDTTYKGYWEQRGYSNDGDLNKDFFE